MIAGDNSILQRATDAKINTEEAEIKERIQLAHLAALSRTNGLDDYDILVEELGKEFGTKETDWDISEETVTPWKVTVGKVEYEIEGTSLTKQLESGLYYADTDELIMTWEELIDSNNSMLQDNSGTLSRSYFDLGNVTDKSGHIVGSTALVKLVVDKSITTIGSMAGLNQIAELELPNTITTINSGALYRME